MSHFTVLVVCPDGTDIDNYYERVTELMAPYDEQRDVEWRPSEDDEDGGYWHNPDGHWDYWTVGGRWRGYFPVADGVTDDDLKQVVSTDGRRNPVTGEDDGFDPLKREGRIDGGPKRCLGFSKLRDIRGREAVEEWNNYAAAIDGTEQHVYWSEFVARVNASDDQAALTLGADRRGLLERCHRETCEELGMEPSENGWPKIEDGPEYRRWKARDDERWKRYDAQWDAATTYTIKEARADYWSQPRVAAVKRSPTFAKRFDIPTDEIDPYTRDEFEDRARVAAVPAFAVVLPDATWCAPGRVGWFGMSSDNDDDRHNFAVRMNSYLDELNEDTFLVLLDCHT